MWRNLKTKYLISLISCKTERKGKENSGKTQRINPISGKNSEYAASYQIKENRRKKTNRWVGQPRITYSW